MAGPWYLMEIVSKYLSKFPGPRSVSGRELTQVLDLSCRKLTVNRPQNQIRSFFSRFEPRNCCSLATTIRGEFSDRFLIGQFFVGSNKSTNQRASYRFQKNRPIRKWSDNSPLILPRGDLKERLWRARSSPLFPYQVSYDATVPTWDMYLYLISFSSSPHTTQYPWEMWSKYQMHLFAIFSCRIGKIY